MRALVRAHPVRLCAVALFALYAAVSLTRHLVGWTGGYDLGIFTEAVRGYASFGAPIADLKGWDYHLLGDHFHPILVVLVPAFWLWPSPAVLLVAQAALVAWSAAVVGRFAVDRLGRRAGLAVLTGYGLSFGVLFTVLFDFHEVAFAAPLTALACVALAEGRWRAAVAWSLLLLLVKEDFGLTVAAVGVYLFLRRQRFLGAAVAVVGLTVQVLVVLVALPYFNPHGTFDYWGVFGGSSGSDPGAGQLLTILGELPKRLVWPPVKLGTLVVTFGITAFVALRSPLVLLAVPTLVWRFLGGKPDYWGLDMHYSLVLMPVVFLAAVDAVLRLRGSARPAAHTWARWSLRVIPIVGLLPLVAGSVIGLGGQYPLPSTAHQRAVAEVVAQVPDGARVAATNRVAPQLAARARVALYPRDLAGADWVLVDSQRPTHFCDVRAQLDLLAKLPTSGYRLVDQRDGVFLYRRGAGALSVPASTCESALAPARHG